MVSAASNSRGRRHALASLAAVLALASMVLSGIFISCGGKRGGPVPADSASGYCPVCKMNVKAQDKWASEIIYNDGTKLMFESPGDMLSFYTSTAGYDVPDYHKDRANIEKIMVKDYTTGNSIDIEQASLAYKSKVKSPMGPDLVPFAFKKDALLFIEAQGGSLINFSEVTPDIVRNLRKE
jgi:nitrous oxide reductase accessory protein NosL